MTTNENPVKTKRAATFFFTLLFGISVFANGPAQAQISFSINISSQPVWGPVGYDYVEYYYLPQYEVYYYVPTGLFFYRVGPRWVSSVYLPAHYHVDLYNSYKVVINQPRPYLRHKVYATKYAHYKSRPPRQHIIKHSNNSKYFVVKGHPKYKSSFVKSPKTKVTPHKTNYPADKTKAAPVKKYDRKNAPVKYKHKAPVKRENKPAPVHNERMHQNKMPQNNAPRQNQRQAPKNQGGGNKGNKGGKHE